MRGLTTFNKYGLNKVTTFFTSDIISRDDEVKGDHITMSPLNGFFGDINRIMKKLYDKKALTLQESIRLFGFLIHYQNCEGEVKDWCDPDICDFANEKDWINSMSIKNVNDLCDLIQHYLENKLRSRPDHSVKGNSLDDFFDEIYDILKKNVYYKKQLEDSEKSLLFEFIIYHRNCWDNVNKENCYPSICRFASAVDIPWILCLKFDNVCDFIRNYYINDMKIIPPKGGDAMGWVWPGDGFGNQ